MIEAGDIALVLLAAGRAERFGGDKLGAMLAGRTVLDHVLAALAPLEVGHRFAVVRPGRARIAGYEMIEAADPGAPQSRSLGLGVAAAQAAGARAVLVALADMPLVPTSHLRALIAAFASDRAASSGAGTTMPPAIFGARHFAALRALTGDRGAGTLLAGAETIALPVGAEIDIDRPEDLALAERYLARRAR
ncbi:nucleotidyltransferase family protein [Novosphingobium huizhouense]|uniref:nucleotidyltransferase family protein n=1 Tax=Novosphingobium huizhouense TaxID=2866625 RepID=UPI001CD90A5C|nr:nucleotidyltransferase family protein [Novosphingobium huizhouense]